MREVHYRAGRGPYPGHRGHGLEQHARGLVPHEVRQGSRRGRRPPHHAVLQQPTPAGQILHYKTIAEQVDIPIVLYNVPSRTGTNMLPETVAELSRVPNIVAIKEAAGSVDQVSAIRSQCGITVMSGDDSLTLPMMSVGATGVISVAANVAPAGVAAMCAEFDKGNLAEAQRIHFELFPLFKALFLETNPIPVKAALAKMGLIKNILRLPLTPMRAEMFAKLEPVLGQLAPV